LHVRVVGREGQKAYRGWSSFSEELLVGCFLKLWSDAAIGNNSWKAHERRLLRESRAASKFLRRQKAYESIDRQARVTPSMDVNGLSSGLKP